MSHEFDEAHLAVEHAREALRENRRGDARQWAEHAARLAPNLEDPWLILAAVASPKTSLEYIQNALKINPNSARARKGKQWAMQRLSEAGPEMSETQESLVSRLPTAQTPAAAVPVQAPAPRRRLRSPLPVILLGIGLFICMAAGVSAGMSPVLASFIQKAQPARDPSWALASIPKPTYTAGSPLAFDIQPTEGTEPAAAPLLETPTIEANPGYGDMITPTIVE